MLLPCLQAFNGYSMEDTKPCVLAFKALGGGVPVQRLIFLGALFSVTALPSVRAALLQLPNSLLYSLSPPPLPGMPHPPAFPHL